MVLEVLATMVEQFDNLIVSDVEAYTTLPNFLEETARDHCISCRRVGVSSARGVYNCPTAVQCLFESYAKNEAIHKVVAGFRGTKQRLSEDEQAFIPD